MKLVILLAILAGCSQQPKEDPAMTVTNPNAALGQSGGFVEENDMCICTKEYKPVCGSNGQTYPSACQAKCDKITEYTEGPCQK